LPCQWVMFPSHQLGYAPYDQIHIYTSTADDRVKAFLVTVEYRWQGAPATLKTVALRQTNGVGMVTIYFDDTREVQIGSIDIRTLGVLR
jgi:hypothetical protein